jgi:hypothetical protein
MTTGSDKVLDPGTLKALYGDIHAFSVSTVCDKRELFWRRHVVNFKWLEILRVGLSYLREHTWAA